MKPEDKQVIELICFSYHENGGIFLKYVNLVTCGHRKRFIEQGLRIKYGHEIFIVYKTF